MAGLSARGGARGLNGKHPRTGKSFVRMGQRSFIMFARWPAAFIQPAWTRKGPCSRLLYSALKNRLSFAAGYDKISGVVCIVGRSAIDHDPVSEGSRRVLYERLWWKE